MHILPQDIRNIKRQKNLKTSVCFCSETCTLTSNYSDRHDDEESDLGMSDSELDNEYFLNLFFKASHSK